MVLLHLRSENRLLYDPKSDYTVNPINVAHYDARVLGLDLSPFKTGGDKPPWARICNRGGFGGPNRYRNKERKCFFALFGATSVAEFGGMCAVGAAVGRSGPHGDPF